MYQNEHLQNNPAKWGEPTPLDVLNVPEFPVKTLPNVIKDYVLSVSESLQISNDFGATASLGALATALQGKFVVVGKKDWVEPVNLYALIVANPSEMKSAALKLFTSAITAYESKENKARQSEISRSLIKCSHCGGNLVFNRKKLKSTTKEFFRCSTYTQKGKDICPVNSIDYDTVYQAVLSSVQQYAVLAVGDEKKLINDILKSNGESKSKSISRYEKTIRESKNRIREIDGLLQNLYKDKVAGEVTSDLFKRMSQKYTEEQSKLIAEVEQLEIELDEYKCTEQDLTGWIERIKECLYIDSLSRDIVVGLIDRVEVSQAYSVGEETILDISISYKFGHLSQKKTAC